MGSKHTTVTMAIRKLFRMETFNKNIKRHLKHGTADIENQFNKKIE